MSGGAKYAIIGGAVAVAIIAGVAGYLAVPTADMAEEPAVQEPETLTIYSGRSESLIGPLIEQFEEDTGIDAEVRYGKTAGLALAIIEEGENSPADIYFAQDAGALGALSKEGRLLAIPDSILQEVDDAFQSTEGEWVGITGRARVVDYNTNLVDKSELPASIWGFLDPEWKGKIGWAPPNGSFQSFVTALRVVEGEDRAREWLLGIMANEPVAYSGNTPTVEGIARGEVHVGFVNNYYLQRFLAEDPQFPVAHHYTDGDAGLDDKRGRRGNSGHHAEPGPRGAVHRVHAKRRGPELLCDYHLRVSAGGRRGGGGPAIPACGHQHTRHRPERFGRSGGYSGSAKGSKRAVVIVCD